MHSKRRKPLFYYVHGCTVHRECRMRRSDVNSYTNIPQVHGYIYKRVS